MTAPTLTIVDGLQAGSCITLPNGGSLIGTGTAGAVVIADSAMRPDHFEVLVGAATVLRALGQITMLDGSSVAAGSEILLLTSTSFIAGKTQFLIELPVPDLSATPFAACPRRRGPWFVGCGALAALLTAAVSGAWLLGQRPGVMEPTSTAVKSLVLNRPMANTIDCAAVAGALRNRMAAAGLMGVSVTSQPDGTMVVGGLLGTDEAQAWSGVRQWFDAHYGNDVVIVERFGKLDALPPLRIAAVWAGPHPYVVDGRGERLHPGAALGEGWFVDGIANGHVMVRRGSQTIALRYGP
ncbi:MAG: SctD/MshK family protein [Janthinobacterium lividum]